MGKAKLGRFWAIIILFLLNIFTAAAALLPTPEPQTERAFVYRRQPGADGP